MFRKARLLSIRVGLLTALAILTMFLVSVVPSVAETGDDYAIANGWFFTQTGGGQGQGYAVRDTGTDSAGRPTRFWSEFQRLGGVDTLGYPIGQPYTAADGFTYQAFQRSVLQWRPELGRSLPSNTFELLQAGGSDNWLLETKGVPKPISDDGSGGDFSLAVRTRLGWLTNDAISAKFLANPNPGAISDWNRDRAIEFYGLPMSRTEQHGPFITQRFQRTAFQAWVEQVPGMPPVGSVVAVLGGDLMKEAGLLPASSVVALGPGGAAPPQPTAPPTPVTPTHPWRVASVQGWPNCGTTYIRAYVRDGSGNGVNGINLKSWNDWGNEFTAGTRNYQDKDGYWDRVLASGPAAGKWYVVLLDGEGRQSSDVAVVNFSASCAPDQGNVQEVELEFRPR